MSDDVVSQIRRAKVRLAPELNEKFFTRLAELRTGYCDHINNGMTLDEKTRMVTCKCGAVLDPFDALVLFSQSEDRLVMTLDAIEKAAARARQKKLDDKARRPFVRDVVGRIAKKDLTLKAEPIVGYTLQLECGHVADCGPDRVPKRVTCQACKSDDAAGRRDADSTSTSRRGK